MEKVVSLQGVTAAFLNTNMLETIFFIIHGISLKEEIITSKIKVFRAV